MDMEKAMDEAVRAKAQLREILADEISDGTVSLMTAGSSGELHGNHHPTIGVHLSINNVAFRKMRTGLLEKVKPVKDQGVDLIFFPAAPES